ncbi:hypothetical protein L1857_20530 [Amycolatopsis thermalba]|uniref:Integral membrane protein n=1 Tax=Amycolatopsis thermalba TaxID=944492 RepID=A0ABY4NY63_9PSEU|nr:MULTISPECIES: hypothetical protein [Amycolatopsis]UQS25029.1 hypothetical protein L1857_20530 [Amycolatopsis thermalba]
MSDKIVRGVRGVVTALAVTLALLPVHGAALLMLLFAVGRYDSSGQGGPFRSCTADSVSCAGPDVPVVIGCALAVLGGLLLAGWAGRRAGRPRSHSHGGGRRPGRIGGLP